MYILHGGAGVPNFGDELIVRQWLDFLGENQINDILLSGMRVKVLSDIFEAKYPKILLSDYLCRVQSKIHYGLHMPSTLDCLLRLKRKLTVN